MPPPARSSTALQNVAPGKRAYTDAHMMKRDEGACALSQVLADFDVGNQL